MKIVINIISYSIFFYILIFFYQFINEKKENVSCYAVKIKIEQNEDNNFISEKDIWDILNDKNDTIFNKKIQEIDISKIEKKIKEHNSIENAEVYKTINGKLNIEIKERTPILRIIDENNNSIYVDKKGIIMSLSKKYTARVLFANGKINLKNKNLSKDKSFLNLYKIASYIYNKDFWNAQIQQIYINEKEEFELVPKVGSHIILFGKAKNINKKFENLKIFYKNLQKNFFWNKYKTINLKFENQIVCLKK